MTARLQRLLARVAPAATPVTATDPAAGLSSVPVEADRRLDLPGFEMPDDHDFSLTEPDVDAAAHGNVTPLVPAGQAAPRQAHAAETPAVAVAPLAVPQPTPSPIGDAVPRLAVPAPADPTTPALNIGLDIRPDDFVPAPVDSGPVITTESVSTISADAAPVPAIPTPRALLEIRTLVETAAPPPAPAAFAAKRRVDAPLPTIPAPANPEPPRNPSAAIPGPVAVPHDRAMPATPVPRSEDEAAERRTPVRHEAAAASRIGPLPTRRASATLFGMRRR